MKFVPTAISRKLARPEFWAKENSPTILFGVGVTSMVGSTVLACRATLKLDDVLSKIENNVNNQKNAIVADEDPEMDVSYPENERKRDSALILVQGAASIARLYAPSVGLGVVGVTCLTKSHNILKDRNLALTAAYAAVDGAFSRYRERVVDRYGEDVDRDLMYESEEVDIVGPDGELITTTRVVSAPGGAYSRFYAEWSSRNWSPDPDINLMILRNQQNWMNDKLKARGHVFLNEVLDALGMEHTKEGAIVGWRWRENSGEDFISFGIWDGVNERVNEFFHGDEGAIMLTFNVDGVIFDRLPEMELSEVREEEFND